MYSYKTNNSYTIYVNYYYLNECKKASNKYRSEHTGSNKAASTPIKTTIQKTVVPLPNNTVVYHKSFGNGKIVSTENNGHLLVRFGETVRKFIYPQAFEMGFLTRV